jgi:phosphate transport system permease protein
MTSTMDSALHDEPIVPEPQRPWRATRDSLRPVIVSNLVAAVAAFTLNLVTGLAGFDGWLLTFVPIAMVMTFITRRRQGNVIVADAMVTTLVTTIAAVAHALVGTLIMVAIATVITLPLGILTAVYVTEVRGRFTPMVRFIVQSMSGVPSIVAGLFIYSTVVMGFESFSGLAGGLALAILMLPTVARTAEEVLKLVPDDIRSASYALGAPQWRTSLFVVLPTVRSGMVTAGILGIARVAGETAPLLLTASYFTATSFSPVDGPMASLPMFIFGLLQSGTEYSFARAWAASLLLLGSLLVLFTIARLVSGKDKR